MGEIADMILEGQMCQECGEFLGEGDGYPTYCDDCKPEEEIEKRIIASIVKEQKPSKVPCPVCRKKVKPAGLEMHKRDVHGENHD